MFLVVAFLVSPMTSFIHVTEASKSKTWQGIGPQRMKYSTSGWTGSRAWGTSWTSLFKQRTKTMEALKQGKDSPDMMFLKFHAQSLFLTKIQNLQPWLCVEVLNAKTVFLGQILNSNPGRAVFEPYHMAFALDRSQSFSISYLTVNYFAPNFSFH